MIKPEILQEYNKFRHATAQDTLCPAPSMNLHFSQLGIVTACCFNRNEILGVYPENTLDEIWTSEAAKQMRQQLKKGHFPRGCEKCREQILSRDFAGSHANFYSHQAKILSDRKNELSLPSNGLSSFGALPMKLEFNIHNSCNLQCIMCHGLASSSIRVHREGLRAMPNPYDDAFVEQLRKYLPYVVETDFMGGEPFMIPTYQKIWQAISEINPNIKTCILTNATILNDSIKSLLESFNCWIHVSIDSFRKNTYETIRKGASFEEVMKNCNYFNRLMKSTGQSLIWRYCPMRVNWHELPDTVSYCSEEGIKLFFNQVDSPINMSLTTLPADELEKVIDTLTANEPKLPPTEAGLENIQNYRDLISRLSGFLHQSNRNNALNSRLQAAEAVVGKYTPKRENSLKKRPNSDELAEQLSPVIRAYLINRLNVTQAKRNNAEVEQNALDLLQTSQHSVIEVMEDISLEYFIEVYLKELMRVISGVWGVTKVHDKDIFKQIDELIRTATPGDFDNLRSDWEQLLKPEPLHIYENIAHAGSADYIRNWLNTL